MVYLPTILATKSYINIEDRNHTYERRYSNEEKLTNREMAIINRQERSKSVTANESDFWFTIESKPYILNQKTKKHDSIQASNEKDNTS